MRREVAGNWERKSRPSLLIFLGDSSCLFIFVPVRETFEVC